MHPSTELAPCELLPRWRRRPWVAEYHLDGQTGIIHLSERYACQYVCVSHSLPRHVKADNQRIFVYQVIDECPGCDIIGIVHFRGDSVASDVPAVGCPLDIVSRSPPPSLILIPLALSTRVS